MFFSSLSTSGAISCLGREILRRCKKYTYIIKAYLKIYTIIFCNELLFLIFIVYVKDIWHNNNILMIKYYNRLSIKYNRHARKRNIIIKHHIFQ